MKLYLHVHDGTVWHSIDGRHVEDSGQDVLEFIDDSGRIANRDLYVLGMRGNAALLAHLYELKESRQLPIVVHVASPLVCQTQADRESPESVLASMRCFNRAASLGGFHKFEAKDYISYAIVRELVAHNCVTDTARRYAQLHPVWNALQFVPHKNADKCIELLSVIVDPRWYVDVCNPDRLSKLESYLGLNPRTQAGLTGKTPAGDHADACALVAGCWQQAELLNRVLGLFRLHGPTPVADCVEPGLAPGDFAWRMWGTRLGMGSKYKSKGPVMATLRASQLFVGYIRHTWLSALYSDAQKGRDELFSPKAFFRHAEEVEAYTRHMA